MSSGSRMRAWQSSDWSQRIDIEYGKDTLTWWNTRDGQISCADNLESGSREPFFSGWQEVVGALFSKGFMFSISQLGPPYISEPALLTCHRGVHDFPPVFQRLATVAFIACHARWHSLLVMHGGIHCLSCTVAFIACHARWHSLLVMHGGIHCLSCTVAFIACYCGMLDFPRWLTSQGGTTCTVAFTMGIWHVMHSGQWHAWYILSLEWWQLSI